MAFDDDDSIKVERVHAREKEGDGEEEEEEEEANVGEVCKVRAKGRRTTVVVVREGR